MKGQRGGCEAYVLLRKDVRSFLYKVVLHRMGEILMLSERKEDAKKVLERALPLIKNADGQEADGKVIDLSWLVSMCEMQLQMVSGSD